jgi:hypothetical protein
MAQKYWVGGSGTWDSTNTTNWSNTSGGSGGASVPGASDVANFNQAGTYAITIASSAPAVEGVYISVNYAFTLSGSVNLAGYWLQSYGSLSLGGYTLTVRLFSATGFFSNTVSIAFGGGNIVLSGSDASLTISYNFTYTGTFAVSITDTSSSGKSITLDAPFFTESTALSVGSSGSNINIANASSGQLDLFGVFKNITPTGFGGSISIGNSTGITVYGNISLNASSSVSGFNPSQVTLAATSGTQTITSNGASFSRPVVVSSNKVSFADAALIYSSLTITSGTLELPSGATVLVSSFVTTGTTLKYLQATSAGSRATLSRNSGTNTVTYLSIKDSAATGGATWDATSSTNVNAGNVTGWNFGTPANTFFLL